MKPPPSLVLLALLCLGLSAPSARAEDELVAADVTERGRDLPNILDVILVPQKAPGPSGRTIVFLIDVSTSLQKANFDGEFEAALDRHARVLEGTRIGIARTGSKGGLLLKPTPHRALVAQSMREMCAKPDTSFQNVYADLRRIVPEVRRTKGERQIVLVTLENGDAEDNVEQTVSDLRRSDIRTSVICREAFLSDALWVLHPPKGPPNTSFTGSDNAFVDLPWGLRFQWGIPNNWVLSGFAMHGLTRLAAASGGRVFLYYPQAGISHVCCAHRQCSCLFCEGDHRPEGEVYQPQRLRAVSPPAGSRSEVIARAAADPFYRAVQRAWERAARQSLVYSRPSLDRSGGQVRIERYPYGGWIPLGTTVAFKGEAARARRLIQACEKLLRDLDVGLKKAEAQGGIERYRAVAETTRLMFQVTRVNLLLYVAYCEEVAPEEVRRLAASYEPPESAPHPDDQRFLYVGSWQLSLCHGVAPFRAVRMPGGQEMSRELDRLRTTWDAFQSRWAHTPYVLISRRLGLIRFYLVRRPGYVPPGRRRVPDSATEETVTLPERPARPSRPGGGTSGGGDRPVTGGG